MGTEFRGDICIGVLKDNAKIGESTKGLPSAKAQTASGELRGHVWIPRVTSVEPRIEMGGEDNLAANVALNGSLQGREITIPGMANCSMCASVDKSSLSSLKTTKSLVINWVGGHHFYFVFSNMAPEPTSFKPSDGYPIPIMPFTPKFGCPQRAKSSWSMYIIVSWQILKHFRLKLSRPLSHSCYQVMWEKVLLSRSGASGLYIYRRLVFVLHISKSNAVGLSCCILCFIFEFGFVFEGIQHASCRGALSPVISPLSSLPEIF